MRQFWFIVCVCSWAVSALIGQDSLASLKADLQRINTQLQESDNIWLKQYMNLESYNSLNREIFLLKKELESHTSDQEQSESRSLTYRLKTLEAQQELLKEYANNPYHQLLESRSIDEVPSVTNPFLILTGYAFIKHLRNQQSIMENNKASLQALLELLHSKNEILIVLVQADRSEEFASQIARTQIMIEELEGAYKILKTSIEIYAQESHAIITKLNQQIKTQLIKAMYIGVAVLVSVLLAFLLKLTLRKYILDTDRIYTANKVINFINISLIVLIVLFAYMENVSYLVAILGFASAGLAIAMKDLFMSVLGWFVIVLGGSVHVGDRVRVCKDGDTYVGDVLDISVLRITLFEDVTLTSYMENRRAGRIIFVPNNYIFTTMFANYTHGGLKTVWDGIDFSITFDSNHQKAMKIATEIGKKYAKGYTEMVRKQVHRLKDRYSLRNPNLEVRSYCMIEPNGLRISLWYQTNAYATLALRSTISGEIIDRILQEEDIKIAYPTHKIVADGTDGMGEKDIALYGGGAVLQT